MDTKEHILASAQKLVQQRGFNGFSYADVAAEVGIRKASLHHHFPTKTDLGLALVDAYVTQFEAERQRVSGSLLQADAQLKAYVNLYRMNLSAERVCLGGMLASDSSTLDPIMLPALKRFFARNMEWLTEILSAGAAQKIFSYKGTAADHARLLLAALQGGLMIARATGDHEAFDRTVTLLIADLARTD